MILALIIAIAVIVGLLLFLRIAHACGWPIGDRFVARHERELERLKPRQPWE
ncbi:MAG: hypothetical protein ACQERR_05160 [Pseudomonadota bacterium]